MRGLYLLAVGVSFLIGGGLGVFFYTFARYWVGAVGGFCFGWYLLNTRKGGLVTNIGGRWAIIGGFTLGAIVCTLTPRLQEILLLGASAWIGATAFTLGVDCFTRAGLKEVSYRCTSNGADDSSTSITSVTVTSSPLSRAKSFLSLSRCRWSWVSWQPQQL